MCRALLAGLADWPPASKILWSDDVIWWLVKEGQCDGHHMDKILCSKTSHFARKWNTYLSSRTKQHIFLPDSKITFYRGQLRCDSTQCRCPLCPLDHLLVVPETRFVQKNVGCDNEKYDIDTPLPGLWIKKRTSNSKVFHLKSRFSGHIDNCLREYELPRIEIPESN